MNAGGAGRLRTHRPRLVAADPGRVRLTNASIVASAVLLSAFCAWLMVTFAHADHALMAVGTFLALQTGLVAKGATSRERLLTTALLILPVVASLTLATALSGRRPVEIVGFIVVGGLATWVRRFGPRYTAMGMVAFLGYFFALFLRPTFAQLPQFFAIAACAVGSVLLLRLVTVSDRPHHQIALLLAQLRGACVAALGTATTAGPPALPVLRQDLRRIDQVGLAITGWQSRFATARHVDCDASSLAISVLNARIDTEHACVEIVQRREAGDSRAAELLTAPIADLRVVLRTGSTEAAVDGAAARATARLHDPDRSTADVLAAAVTDRATISHAVLRRLRLHRRPAVPPAPGPPAPAPGSASTAEGTTGSAAPGTGSPPPPAAAGRTRWWQKWQDWPVTSRMAGQVMVAAGLATVTGEAISASRWYWAVLTAFLVFAGTTTRGAVLTRASRRIVGTLGGVLVGFGLAVLFDGDIAALTAMCVVAVFCMLYFGPLQYTATAFFVTIVLAALYGLLGILDRHILELRLTETAVGAVIGVACAYLIFSTTSRSAVRQQTTAYFTALDDLLIAVRTALTGDDAQEGVLEASAGLDAAAAAVHDTLNSLSVSLLAGHRAQAAELDGLKDMITRLAGRLADVAISLTTGTSAIPADPALRPALAASVDEVRTGAVQARDALLTGDPGPASTTDTTVPGLLQAVPDDDRSDQGTAARMLSRLDWALQRVVQIRRTG